MCVTVLSIQVCLYMSFSHSYSYMHLLRKVHYHVLKFPSLSAILSAPPRVAFKNSKILKSLVLKPELNAEPTIGEDECKFPRSNGQVFAYLTEGGNLNAVLKRKMCHKSCHKSTVNIKIL